MGGVRGRPRKVVGDIPAPNEEATKEAADKWFAVFFIVRARYPDADVWAQIAATDWALRND